MSRYVDIERLAPMQVENSEVELGILVYDYDAVQSEPFIDIVCCKDCKYWVSDGGALMRCDIHKDPTVPDHYCSYGEEDKDE